VMDEPLIKINESPTSAAIRWSKRALAAEAQLRPRSMESAPNNGSEFVLVARARCNEKGRVVRLHSPHGWIPTMSGGES
jgi:hypothetical protein